MPFLRPAELAGDESTAIDVCVHALRWLDEREGSRPDYVALLQPTSPLRTAADIDAAIRLALDRRAEAVVGVTHPGQHPWLFSELEAGGTLQPLGEKPARRQDFPPVVVTTGAIYVASRHCLLEQRTFQPPGGAGLRPAAGTVHRH